MPPLVRTQMDVLNDGDLLDAVHERVILKLPDTVEDPGWEDVSEEESYTALAFRWLDELLEESVATVFASNSPLHIEGCRVSFSAVGLEKLWQSLDTALRFCAAHRFEAFMLHNHIYEEADSELLDGDLASIEELFEPFQRDIEAHLEQADTIVASYVRAHPDVFCDD